MFPIVTKAGSKCPCFPDVCKTQVGPATVPIPYPNLADSADADDGSCSQKTVCEQKKIVLKKTKITTSVGDEAGALKGILSNQNKGKAVFMTACMKVKVEGHPVVHLTCSTQQNCSEIPNGLNGITAASTQLKTVIQTRNGKTREIKAKDNTYHEDTAETYPPDGATQGAADALAEGAGGTPQQLSEALGEAGAINAINQFFGDQVRRIVTFAGANTVDILVTLANGVLVVVEAKGGRSPLGSRDVGGTRYAQGTPSYLNGTADRMASSGATPGEVLGSPGQTVPRAAAGADLQDAIQRGDCVYMEARTDHDGNTTLKEFDP